MRTIQSIQIEQAVWAQRNFGDRNPYDAILGIMEELGELSHAMLKKKQGIRGSEEEHIAAAKDAIGDMLVYMLDFCTGMKWDMMQILDETWTEVEKRDWVANRQDGKVDEWKGQARSQELDMPPDMPPDYTPYHCLTEVEKEYRRQQRSQEGIR